MIDIQEQRAKLARLEQAYEMVDQIQQMISGLRDDVARCERRRDAFRAHGKRRIEIPDQASLPGLPPIELEPRRSRLTGAELAAGVQAEIDNLQREIKRHEAEAAALLKS
jgi:hypothetical protein